MQPTLTSYATIECLRNGSYVAVFGAYIPGKKQKETETYILILSLEKYISQRETYKIVFFQRSCQLLKQLKWAYVDYESVSTGFNERMWIIHGAG